MDEGLSPNIVAEGGRAYDYPEEDINANDFKMASDHSNHVCAGCNCYRPITTIPDQIDTQDFKKPRPHLAIRNPNYLCGDGTNTSIIDNRLEDPFGNEGVLFNKGESLSAPANAGSLGSNSKNRSILKIRRRLSFNFKRSQRIGSIAKRIGSSINSAIFSSSGDVTGTSAALDGLFSFSRLFPRKDQDKNSNDGESLQLPSAQEILSLSDEIEVQFESGTKSISSNSKAGKGCLVNSEGSSGSDAEGRTPPDVTFSVSEPSEAVLSASNTEVKCTSPMEGFPQKSTDSSETQNDIKKDPDVEEDLSMFNVILRRNNDRIMKYSSTMRQGSTLANSVRMWERLSTVGQSNTDSPDLPDGVVSSPSRHVVTENIKEAQQESQTCEVTPLSSTPRNSDSKYQMLRLSVINELIKTEKDYVKDLEIIIQKFLIPIHSSGTITMCEESRLFSNIEAIYEVNLSFLRKLQERERESPEMKDMADILVEIVRDLYVYSDYCSNYPAAIRTSKKLLEENKELKALMNNILKDPEIRGLSFGSFLIKPIQRICKYPLLIKDLDKYTSKISRETIHIKLALKKLDEVMQLINNSTQVLDEEPLYASIISRINPPLPFSPQKKRLIREGYLGLYSAFIMRRRYCVLLENAFIVFRPERNGELRWLNVVIFDHHTAIDITEDLSKTVIRASRVAFRVSVPSQCFECIFIANSEIEKVKWVESFNYTIKKCKRDYDEGKVVFCRRSICGTTVGTLKGAAEACPESEASQGHKHTSSKRFSLGRGIYSYIPLIGNKSKSMATMYLPGNCERQVIADATNNDSDISTNNQNSHCSRNPWREAISAMGIKYYYNVETKETSWLVPADLSRNPRYSNTTARAEGTPSLNRTISVDSIGSKSYSTILSGVATPQELFNIAHHVKGHPNWYYLYSAETPYYFNPSTRESSWSPPL